MLNWNTIDTVLLDMDGTLLDLHFDNVFWVDYLPKKYAEHHGQSVQWAQAAIGPMMSAIQGQLNWYCLDYWTRELGLPIMELKREIAHLIRLRRDAELFLQALQRSQRQVLLVTNAHPSSLSLKLEKVELNNYFQRMVSSHEYGFPKENQSFWQALHADVAFAPERTLFIDDSLSVLRSAQRYGVGHLLAVRQPDSQGERRDTEEFSAVDDYAELTTGLA